MKHLYLSILRKTAMLSLFWAEVRLDGAQRTHEAAKIELQRAAAFEEYMKAQLYTAQTVARSANFELSRNERHKMLGI